MNFSYKKYLSVKKKKFQTFFERKKKKSVICELFVNTYHLTIIIIIPICKLWNSQTIPIPIRTEVATQIYSYSYFWEKLLFADHCTGLEIKYLKSLLTSSSNTILC